MNAFFSHIDRAKAGSVALFGLPTDGNASFLRGAARAPDLIRKALQSESSNLCAENGIELTAESGFVDFGNLDIGSSAKAIDSITAAVTRLLAYNLRPVALGGDHSITYPILRSFAAAHKAPTVLQFDAHPDLYDTFDGNRYSHACPFARIMEEKLVSRLIQVGIRAANAHQRQQAKRFGVEMLEMHFHSEPVELRLSGPVYVSIDMDVLDPAFAPGVSHPEPGGMTTRQVLDIIHRIRVPIAGADIVECNPDRDLGEITVRTAAKLLKEIAGSMLSAG
jgi:agmatinase